MSWRQKPSRSDEVMTGCFKFILALIIIIVGLIVGFALGGHWSPRR